MADLETAPRPVVLVVEDDPLLRMHAMDVVVDAGYEAAEAWNADEAMSVLETLRGVGIVLTNIHMPGRMDGMRLAGAIGLRWPMIGIILTSAHAPPAPGELPVRGVFLAKPYDDDEVLGAIRTFAA